MRLSLKPWDRTVGLQAQFPQVIRRLWWEARLGPVLAVAVGVSDLTDFGMHLEAPFFIGAYFVSVYIIVCVNNVYWFNTRGSAP